MKSFSTQNKIIYHDDILGYVRLEAPLVKKLSWDYSYRNLKKSSAFMSSCGIKDIHLNPFNGNIIIRYEPNNVDILDYIKEISSETGFQKLLFEVKQ